MTSGRPAAPPRPAGSMSLLVDMTAAALDPAYQEVASRGPRPARSYGRVVAVLALVGLGTGVVTAQVRQRADQLDSTRRTLLADVRSETAGTDRLEAEANRQRSAVNLTRQAVLSADAAGRSAAAQVADLELVTGVAPVHGPGIKVVLDNADGTSATNAQQGDGRIFDGDLQEIANALWAAGAEAIAVNGQRLTAQTAIRSAGEAILVDLRPLTAPYVVEAIGEVDTLEPRFVDGPTARKFQTWTSLYGIGFDVRRAHDLSLPAAAAPDLSSARAGGAP